MSIPLKYCSFRGYPFPFGLSFHGEWVNFALFSHHATEVTLLLFSAEDKKPLQAIALDPKVHKTGDVWHIALAAVPEGTLYGYRINGPHGSTSGCKHPFDPKKTLIDPYATVISGAEIWGKRTTDRQLLGAVINNVFDWEGDAPLQIPIEETIIYELHVRGFTKSSTSAVNHPGTYLGLIEKIPYLKKLGITAVELLPIHEFNENEIKFTTPGSNKPLTNLWGYNSVNFFSPKAGYAADKAVGSQIKEFKTLVKTLHQAGIEIILDVVFNHTGEGDHSGPTLSFKGIDNSIYYLLDSTSDEYLNYSGCGNTLNCNHPIVRELIITALRYWVVEMHVDGFRFDLAAIFSRGQDGEVLDNPPLIEQIAADPILAHSKIIAEAWDAAGLYQVGTFSKNPHWTEWNGRFRDDLRAFMCGYDHSVTALATRIAGSSDLFQDSQRPPNCSINFVTCHDGFTLYDLVSYNNKQNTANGEGNRDGDNHNISWNSGAEGPTTSSIIQKLRFRRMRTMATILLLSQGTPMLLAGDEFCRSQQGNNNAYCQDNPLSWVNWKLASKHHDMLRFFRLLIQFRKDHPAFRRTTFFTADAGGKPPEISWQGCQRGVEEWSATTHLLCFFLNGHRSGDSNNFFVAVNSDPKAQTIELPPPGNTGKWHLIINTAQPSPNDIVTHGKSRPHPTNSIIIESMAAILLMA